MNIKFVLSILLLAFLFVTIKMVEQAQAAGSSTNWAYIVYLFVAASFYKLLKARPQEF